MQDTPQIKSNGTLDMRYKANKQKIKAERRYIQQIIAQNSRAERIWNRPLTRWQRFKKFLGKVKKVLVY